MSRPPGHAFPDGQAFLASLATRLRRHSPGPRYQRALKVFTFTRLLDRIAVEFADSMILKGGMALELRIPGRARMTRDIDLRFSGDATKLHDRLGVAGMIDRGDFLTYTFARPHRGSRCRRRRGAIRTRRSRATRSCRGPISTRPTRRSRRSSIRSSARTPSRAGSPRAGAGPDRQSWNRFSDVVSWPCLSPCSASDRSLVVLRRRAPSTWTKLHRSLVASSGSFLMIS
jgi:Nucleotidyl transferase AbiEii toxin, Type IV TA system